MWSVSGYNPTLIWFLLFIAVTNCHCTETCFVRVTKWIMVFVIHHEKMFWTPRSSNTSNSCLVSSLLLSFVHYFIFFCFYFFLSMYCLLCRGRMNITLPSNSGFLGYNFRPDDRLSWLSYFVAFHSLQANGGAAPQNGPWQLPSISSSIHYSFTILLFHAIIFYCWGRLRICVCRNVAADPFFFIPGMLDERLWRIDGMIDGRVNWWTRKNPYPTATLCTKNSTHSALWARLGLRTTKPPSLWQAYLTLYRMSCYEHR